MKRIKIMLLSLVVLAVLGGVMAFRAKDENYCIYKIVDTSCPRQSVFPETVTIAANGIYYSLPKSECPFTVPKVFCTIKILFSAID